MVISTVALVRGNPVRSAAFRRSAAASAPGALRHPGSASIAAIAVINMMVVMTHTVHEHASGDNARSRERRGFCRERSRLAANLGGEWRRGRLRDFVATNDHVV